MTMTYFLLEIPGYILDLSWIVWLIWLVINIFLSFGVLRAKSLSERSKKLSEGNESSETGGKTIEKFDFSTDLSSKSKVELKRPQTTCPKCEGKGWVECECENCRGIGKI